MSYTKVQRGTTIIPLSSKEGESSIGRYMRGVGGWAIIDEFHDDGSMIITLKWKDTDGSSIGHSWKCTK